MKISVVIPNYNGKLLLERNLEKVINQSNNAQIIVVDDASTDESVQYVKKNFPKVTLIVKRKNSGFSSTVNLGVKNAEGDLVVLLNSDVYPKKNYIDHLMPYFKDPSVFAVGMLHQNIEGNKTVLRGRGLAEFKKGFLVHRRGDVDKNDTFWVNAGAGIFRKTIWNTLGGLREIYDPFYWEDIDLSWRAKKQGYKIYFEPKGKIVHIQSEGAIRSKYSPSQIKTIAYRNQFIFVWSNLRQPRYLIKHLLWLPYHFLKLRQKEFLLGFLQAISKVLYNSINRY